MNDQRTKRVRRAILAVAVSVSPAWADDVVTLTGVRVTRACVDALLLLPGGRVVAGPDLLSSCSVSDHEDGDLLVYDPAAGTCLPLDLATATGLDPDTEVVDHDTGAAGRLEAVLESLYADDAAPMVAIDAEGGSFSRLDAGPLCASGGFRSNVRPVAVDDAATTPEGTPVTVDVLANDSDSDGDTLSVTAVGPAPHGTTTFSSTSVTYSPAAAFAGTDTFSYTISDGRGGTDTATVTVTVEDRTAPIVTAPASIVVAAVDAAGTPASDPAIEAFLAGAVATDDADGSVEATALAPPALFPLGTTAVTFTATDAAGNTGQSAASVTVVDRTPPALTVPPDVVAEANGNPLSVVHPGTATATDLVDGSVLVASDVPAAGFPLGMTVVAYTALDAAGNAAAGTQRVTVVDTTPPALRAPEDKDVIATDALTPVGIGEPTAQDLFGPVSIANDAPAAFPLGETIVTWVATDLNGNRATAAQRVRVRYASVTFLPPLSTGGLYKAGRVLPVKIAVAFADGRLATGLVPTINVARLAHGEPVGEPLEVQAAGAASGGNTFVETATHYQFNLDTSGLGAGWIRISADLGDGGSAHAIDVALK